MGSGREWWRGRRLQTKQEWWWLGARALAPTVRGNAWATLNWSSGRPALRLFADVSPSSGSPNRYCLAGVLISAGSCWSLHCVIAIKHVIILNCTTRSSSASRLQHMYGYTPQLVYKVRLNLAHPNVYCFKNFQFIFLYLNAIAVFLRTRSMQMYQHKCKKRAG